MAVYLRIDGIDVDDLADAAPDDADEGYTVGHDLADRVFCHIEQDYSELYDSLDGVIPVHHAGTAVALAAADPNTPWPDDVGGRRPTVLVLEAVARDAENDIDYLLGLVREALDDEENFASDMERARWAVCAFCQETDIVPDIEYLPATQDISPGEEEVHELVSPGDQEVREL